MTKKYFFILPLLFLSLFVSAQSIRLNGKVVNEKNEPVPGASVSVEGITRVIVADIEGRFSLNLETGKKYVITITSAGYNAKSVEDVEVKKGEEGNVLTIVLENKSLDAVVVRTSVRRESTAALINFQKNNSSLSSGLAADFIRRTPDKNTGEVLKRVSGASIQDNKFVVVRGLSDRYNQALLNDAPMVSSEPDKKAFSFDIIPSAMIDNVIINKTATPDMPGEFAGGLVQINTRDIPNKSQLSVGLSVGYNTQSTFKDFTSNARNSTDWLGFDNGNRNLPKGIPSTVGYRKMTDAQKIEATKLFKGDVYQEETNKAIPITTLNLTWSNVANFKDGSKLGTIVSVYHRQSQIIYDEVKRGRFQENREAIFTGDEQQNRYSVNAGALANITYVKGKHKISFKNLFNQLYEDNYYTRSLANNNRNQVLELRSSFLNQRSLYSGQLEGEHALTASGIKLKWNGNFAYNFKSQPDFRTTQFGRPIENPDASFQMDDDDTRRFFSTLRDYTTGGNGSLSIPFTLGGAKQTLKVGGGSVLRVRDFKSRTFRYEAANHEITKPYNTAFRLENVNGQGVFLDEMTQNTDKYFGSSALNSGFVMFDNKIGDDFRLIWGLRAEFFHQFLSTRNQSDKRIVVDNEKWDFLPSVNLTYTINNKNQIRLAASRTVARPEFREIAPFQFFDYEQIWGLAGNPDLKRTAILNADLRYEFYPKSGELISFGILAKHFDDPIEMRMDQSTNADRWLFNYTNSDKATLYGAEVEIRKSLDFIAPALSPITFIGNFTYLDSKVTLTTEQASGQKSDIDRPLYGQSPYLINAGLQFSKGEWNATALYNRIGPRLYVVGDPTIGFFDLYEKPRNVIDLQLSKRVFSNKGELKLTVSDLLNNKFAFYDNPSDKAGYNASKGDRINYSYTPGTNITIGFTYDFDLKK